MALFLFSASVLLSFASAAPVISAKENCKDSSISLSSSGWSFPLTSLSDNQQCSYKFTVPRGFFADVDFHVLNMKMGESAEIKDDFDDSYRALLISSPFNSTIAWPSDFQMDVHSGMDTDMQISANITLHQASPFDNIVKSYVTFPGCGSVFLYAQEWIQGQSYKFTSKGSKIYISGASFHGSMTSSAFNNVFLYDNNVLVGTLEKVAREGGQYISKSNNVVLYAARQIPLIGAVMVTDYTNVADLAHHSLYYVPMTGKGHSFPEMISASESKEGAITLVSNHDNSNNVNVVDLFVSGNGTYSYISGGPIQNHSNAKNISASSLPLYVYGYANTYYLSQGEGMITYQTADN